MFSVNVSVITYIILFMFIYKLLYIYITFNSLINVYTKLEFVLAFLYSPYIFIHLNQYLILFSYFFIFVYLYY